MRKLVDELTVIELRRELKKLNLSVNYKLKEELVVRLKNELKANEIEYNTDIESGSDTDTQSLTGSREQLAAGREKTTEEDRKISKQAADRDNETKNVLDRELARNKSQLVSDNITCASNHNIKTATTSKGDKVQGKMENNTKLFSFRDIEESLEHFEGSNYDTWLQNFEDIANICEWNDVQKIIYGRKLLRGAPKLFMEVSPTIKTWDSFKEVMGNEFGKNKSSFAVHNEMSNRKIERNETFTEYIYKMQRLGSSIDEASIIKYIIAGLPGTPQEKFALYEAENVTALKNKVKIFEEIFKSRFKASSGQTSRSANQPAFRSDMKKLHCYNCGSTDHLKSQCKSDTKCFKCNGVGHIASHCPEGRTVHVINNSRSMKSIKINEYQLEALIDTGSEITLLRKDVFDNLITVALDKNSVELTGLGAGKASSIGSFIGKFVVDGVELRGCCHVVPVNAIQFNCILGGNLLAQAKIVLDKNGIRFYDQNIRDKEELSIMQIAVDDREVNVDHRYADVVEEMIKSYEPEQPKESIIELKIMLEDENPIYFQPSRIPIAHQVEVKKQLSEWIKNGIVTPSNSPFASRVVLVKKGMEAFVCALTTGN